MASPKNQKDCTDAEVYTDYQQVRVLTDVESDQDPEEEPFKSLYAARAILEKRIIPKLTESDNKLRLTCARYQLGVNLKLTNEISEAKRVLEGCLRDIESETDVTQTALIKVNILQDLAICYSSLNEPAQTKDPSKPPTAAVGLLLQAKALLDDKTCKPESSLTIDELMCPPATDFIKVDVRKKVLASAMLQTVFCLGQAYQQISDGKNASQYISQTLKLQYEQNAYQAGKWAIDCAALSQYYISSGHFRQGFVCLECSEYMISRVQASQDAKRAADDPENEASDITPAKLKEAKADIARCWVKLVVNFLEYAAVLKIRDGQLGHAKALSVTNDVDPDKFSEAVTHFYFNIPKTFKSVPFDVKVLLKPLELDWAGASEMFKFGMHACSFASSFFNEPNGFVTDAVELVQDRSQLWQYLSCFEPDPKRQCQMQKRRFRAIERFTIEIDTKLAAKYYGDVLKQLWNTTAEIFADIMTLKLTILARLSSNASAAGDSNPTKVRRIMERKINKAGFCAIKAAHEFRDLFIGADGNVFSNDSERRAYLLMLMRTGRTWQKLFTFSEQEQREYMRQANQCFQDINHFDNSTTLLREEELRLCEEFRQLLPAAADGLR